MSIQSSLHGKATRFLGKLLSVSVLVWGLGVAFTPALAAVTVDQQPLITQKPLAPNIVLMLDDSGSMDWDYMPDWSYLERHQRGRPARMRQSMASTTTQSRITRCHPRPTATHCYPNSPGIGNAYTDGFRDLSQVDVTTYYGAFPYYTRFTIATNSTYGAYKSDQPSCPSGYNWYAGTTAGSCKKDNNPNKGSYTDPVYLYTCNYGDTLTSGNQCQTTSYSYKYYFTYTTGAVGGPYTQHYVGKSGDCASLPSAQQAVCDDTAATRQNVANWFSYYRTRMLMAKSGLMNALSRCGPDLPDGLWLHQRQQRRRAASDQGQVRQQQQLHRPGAAVRRRLGRHPEGQRSGAG